MAPAIHCELPRISRCNGHFCQVCHQHHCHTIQLNHAFSFMRKDSWIFISIYLVVYSLHRNVLPTLQSVPLMTKLVQCWVCNILRNEVKVCWWPGYCHFKLTSGHDDTWVKQMYSCLILGGIASNFLITFLNKDIKFKHMINFTWGNSAQNGFEYKLGCIACTKHL